MENIWTKRESIEVERWRDPAPILSRRPPRPSSIAAKQEEADRFIDYAGEGEVMIPAGGKRFGM
jgi:hypothetical protein